MQIDFPYYGQTCAVDAGATVADACVAAGHPLDLVCGGLGNCGKCLTLVQENGLTFEVLACQYPASDGMHILISPDGAHKKILTKAIAFDPLTFDPSVTAYPVAFNALNLQSDRAFLASINAVLPVDLRCDDPQVLYDAYEAIRRTPGPIVSVLVEMPLVPIETARNAAKAAGHMLAAVPSNHAASMLGAAFDIGTTTVAGYLYDLENGAWLATASAGNAQSAFGADVVSRIDAAASGRGDALRQAIIATLSELLATLCQKAHAQTQDIIHLIACGNTTMLHLFAGLNPEGLGHAPFKSQITGMLTFHPTDFGPPLHPAAIVRLLPPLGGFVGSDTTALLAALPRRSGNHLVIDLGTNGELAVGSREHYTVCATACGPALEGDGLTMGMRGISGAIERVTYTDHFACQVIDAPPAKGICGSGIIDAVAALLDTGLLERSGRFVTGNALAQNPNAAMLRKDGRVTSFVLLSTEENAGGPEITISQKDIRAIQLAKGAIQAATQLLLRHAGLTPKDIDTVYLAGAFGNYIRVESAQKIGLIPDWPNTPVVACGNGAGSGAIRALLSKDVLREINALPEHCEVINLAEDPTFNDTFLKCIDFKNA